jgi:oligopeptide/dipeptide ABC transporter ATP-binding protein
MTLMGLTRGPNASFEGSAKFDGTDLVTAPEDELRQIRGAGIAMVFQDPMSSLDPVYKIGKQIVEQIRVHNKNISKAQAHDRAIELLERVGIPRATERVDAYPHEFSGGMRQRVMIAMALSNDPKLLIADEPTTALDVTIQAQILDEVRQLRRQRESGIILVTHDLGVVADIADRVVVMYAGRVVEQGTLDEIFYDPQHPYTWGLLGSITRVDRDRSQRLLAIPGMPPSLLRPPEGCHFRPRCPFAFEKCTEVPPLTARLPDTADHLDRCWLEVPQKRELRKRGDQIGLRTKETVIS